MPKLDVKFEKQAPCFRTCRWKDKLSGRGQLCLSSLCRVTPPAEILFPPPGNAQLVAPNVTTLSMTLMLGGNFTVCYKVACGGYVPLRPLVVYGPTTATVDLSGANCTGASTIVRVTGQGLGTGLCLCVCWRALLGPVFPHPRLLHSKPFRSLSGGFYFTSGSLPCTPAPSQGCGLAATPVPAHLFCCSL